MENQHKSDLYIYNRPLLGLSFEGALEVTWRGCLWTVEVMVVVGIWYLVVERGGRRKTVTNYSEMRGTTNK